MTIVNGGNVGIGTTSPQNKLHVINGSANSSGDGLTVATLHVTGPNVLTTTSNATLIVATNDALGIDIGGSIGFAGRYSSTSQFTAAQISGRKEDATSGNYGGYLAFCTRAHGTQLSEKVRISGSGNLLVGTTSAAGSMGNAGGITTAGIKTYGSSAAIAASTPTTIATITQAGLYIVHAYVPSYNAGTSDWSNFAIISCTASSPTGVQVSVLMQASGSAPITFSTSGANIRATVGSALTLYWDILKLG